MASSNTEIMCPCLECGGFVDEVEIHQVRMYNLLAYVSFRDELRTLQYYQYHMYVYS